jgi:hypothetical protein
LGCAAWRCHAQNAALGPAGATDEKQRMMGSASCCWCLGVSTGFGVQQIMKVADFAEPSWCGADNALHVAQCAVRSIQHMLLEL